MAEDIVNVTEGTDVVAVTETTDSIMPIVNETTITGEGQTDAVTVIDADGDVVNISEVTETFQVQEVTETVQPQFSEVIVQVVEDSSMPYAKRIDFIDDDNFYRGQAIPGTLESAAAWRISKVSIAVDGDTTTLWAAGNATFDKVWDDHLTLGYS